jgi:hypothetical protein
LGRYDLISKTRDKKPTEEGTEGLMEVMTLIKDGRDWRVSVDGGWTIENGALVLSMKQAHQLVNILTVNTIEEMEKEDG